MGVPGSRSQGGHREPGMLISLAPQRAPVNRSTTDFSMDQPSLQDSTKYPPGYGDFALHCSDNIICYFPRHLLEYMSPVFEDMFSLPTEAIDCDPTTRSPQPPLQLTEDSVTIEALLKHIDPKRKGALKINPDTIIGLLEAARKYQISTITEWFMEEAVLHRTESSPGSLVVTEPFASTHPNPALQCAILFNFPLLGRQALRELAGADSSQIQSESTDIQSIAYICQHKLRETRVARYQSYISTLLECLKGWKGNQVTCRGCRDFLSGWFLYMERAIMVNPRWRSFSQAFEKEKKCGVTSCGSPLSWANTFRSVVDAWEKEAMKLEDELPEWPFV